MHNKLLSIDAKLGKDRFKGLEMTESNDKEKFTSQVLYKMQPSWKKYVTNDVAMGNFPGCFSSTS